MWNALSVSASGLAYTAQRMNSAAGKVARALTPAPAPQTPVPAPLSVAPPAAGGPTAIAAQSGSGTAESWMVEILNAQAAYRANAAAYKIAAQTAKQTIDIKS